MKFAVVKQWPGLALKHAHVQVFQINFQHVFGLEPATAWIILSVFLEIFYPCQFDYPAKCNGDIHLVYGAEDLLLYISLNSLMHFGYPWSKKSLVLVWNNLNDAGVTRIIVLDLRKVFRHLSYGGAWRIVRRSHDVKQVFCPC